MREIGDRDEPISREEWDRDAAIAFFRELGEAYKAEIIADIPSGEVISLYRQGDYLREIVGMLVDDQLPQLLEPRRGRLDHEQRLLVIAQLTFPAVDRANRVDDVDASGQSALDGRAREHGSLIDRCRNVDNVADG